MGNALGKFDPAAAALMAANLGSFTKYLSKKDANAPYKSTFCIGGNMYDKDHDVDTVALIEECFLAIVSDSMMSQTTGIPKKDPRQVRISDDLSAADSLLRFAAPTDKIQ